MEDATPKPDPAPVRLALERLGVATAWMLGDTPDDLAAARGAGRGADRGGRARRRPRTGPRDARPGRRGAGARPCRRPAGGAAMTSRSATVERSTRETRIRLVLDLDGSSRRSEVATGIGFLDHLLTALAFHAGWDLELRVRGRPRGRRPPHRRGLRARARRGGATARSAIAGASRASAGPTRPSTRRWRGRWSTSPAALAGGRARARAGGPGRPRRGERRPRAAVVRSRPRRRGPRRRRSAAPTTTTAPRRRSRPSPSPSARRSRRPATRSCPAPRGCWCELRRRGGAHRHRRTWPRCWRPWSGPAARREWWRRPMRSTAPSGSCSPGSAPSAR